MDASSPEPAPDPPPPLEKGREAFDRRAWKAAHEALTTARRTTSLGPGDLWRFALASYLVGREEDFLEALQDGHRAHLEAGEKTAAARQAFWIGFHLVNRGEMGRATGWFQRAARLLEAEDGECAERGYLMLPEGHGRLSGGDYEGAARIGAEAAAIGQRVGDPDLFAIALHLQGRALLGQARIPDGLALLDETMVSVSTGELSPHVRGLIYCSVIGACRQVYALGRAWEWTAALTEWCESQPDMVPYAGECQLYRAEILQLHGDWEAALEEAGRAAEHLAGGGEPRAAGLALYRKGEVLRLEGDFEGAEEAYRAASRTGREPQPGLALLRMAQDETDAAAAAIRRALAETPDRLRRARLLPAHIEIMLEAGEVEEARGACDELSEIAAGCARGALQTVISQARGAIALAEGDASAALPLLRSAWREWQELGMPWDAARVRVLLGRACRELGDMDSGDLELEAARSTFERLGAAPDVARVDALLRRHAPPPGGDHGLTPRELEVLALVATGRTNRAIAEELFISEKTVARHVSNIFGKLGLSSRAAATAYAYEHGLTDPSA